MTTEFPYNPIHPIATCGTCGEEMIYNVPRLGPNGGFIHKSSMSFACDSAKLKYHLDCIGIEGCKASTETVQ